VIILDDAFQHRSITAGFNILLTDCNNLFTRDFFLPAGDLRDQRSSYKRANVVVVTKCPNELTRAEKDRIIKEIKPLAFQKVFFTTIQYGSPYHIISREERLVKLHDDILLVCGIANPRPLKSYLVKNAKIHEMPYSDHHIYTLHDFNKIRERFKAIREEQKLIITTEKDAVRLIKFKDELIDMPVFVIPVQHRFLFDEGMQFDNIVTTFIQTFS
jgi:tetraacyldisaccharide 4'-kinase